MTWRTPFFLMTALLLTVPAARADDGERVLVVEPLPGTPEHLIQQVFVAAQFDDFRGFYGDLCHRDTCTLTDVAMKSFQAGPWEKFKANFKRCLVDEDSLSYKYERMSPKKLTPRTNKVTFYFEGGSMILKKDAEGAWKIYRLCE
ncbi:MAG: hypothetical protein ABIK09_08900 [Pseudomonadota bacterium]